MNDPRPPAKAHPEAGFSLIETMIASIILGMVITGVTSMVTMGSSLEIEGGLRRQAAMIAAAALERVDFHYSNYAGIGAAPPDAPVLLKTSHGNDVPAQLKISIVPGPVQMIDLDGGPDIPIDMKTIRSTVEWTFDERVVSVSFEKSISEVE